MEVSLDQTLAHLRRREGDRRVAQERRIAEIRARLPEAADRLRHLGARRIWLFGSLAAGRPHPRSDVDLAVEGLAPERYLDALADLMGLLPASVDLIDLDRASEALRARVIDEGVAL